MALKAARWTIVGLAMLGLLEVLWETVLAPMPAGGIWLAVKAVPLAILFPGVARGDRRWARSHDRGGDVRGPAPVVSRGTKPRLG